MKVTPFLRLVALAFLLPGAAFALAEPATMADCAAITDDRQRLVCYDRLASRALGNGTSLAVPATPERAVTAQQEKPAIPAAKNEGRQPSNLALHWDLEPYYSHETFTFRPHNGNHILFANYSSSPNDTPFSPLAGLSPQGTSLSDVELTFQLSFKMKLLEDMARTPADLWFGYTQESFWQLYNESASRPFRETDYQPELMLVVPFDFNVLGMRTRFVNFGLNHQSNGRGSSLSRSWTRLYAQLGMERDDFTLTGRVWKRIRGSGSDDDNPDITDYMGHGDVAADYRWNDHVFSAMARYNFSTNRGAARLGWEFPLVTHVNGYLEAFTGYGHSLIDYNHSQNTIGLGLSFRN